MRPFLESPVLMAFAVLLTTACSGGSTPAAPGGADQEAILNAVSAVQADTGPTKQNTEELKSGLATVTADTALAKAQTGQLVAGLSTMTNQADALVSAVAALQADAAAIKGETTGVKSELTALKDSVGTGLHTQLSGVQSSLGTPPSGHSLYTSFMASRRYSRTCDPATDTWLRSAWPGLSDADIKDACLRDGRWHYLGTMRDYITRSITLPEGMQVGLSTYAQSINPATVNSWTTGIRLCVPVIGVGPAGDTTTASFAHECISYSNNLFIVVHKLFDDAGAPFLVRDYRGYTGGSESGLACTVYSTWGYVSCNNSESVAGYWKIYVRQ